MPLGKLWPNRRGTTRARGVITSGLGQKLRFDLGPATSALPRSTDIVRSVRFVPPATDSCTAANDVSIRSDGNDAWLTRVVRMMFLASSPGLPSLKSANPQPPVYFF
jgi:hypothetical protein